MIVGVMHEDVVWKRHERDESSTVRALHGGVFGAQISTTPAPPCHTFLQPIQEPNANEAWMRIVSEGYKTPKMLECQKREWGEASPENLTYTLKDLPESFDLLFSKLVYDGAFADIHMRSH